MLQAITVSMTIVVALVARLAVASRSVRLDLLPRGLSEANWALGLGGGIEELPARLSILHFQIFLTSYFVRI